MLLFAPFPPRPYDVKLSTILELKRQLSIIPKSISNCSFTPSTHTTFIRKGQPIIDDFDPEDKYPRLHQTSSAKSRLSRIIETVVTTKMKTKGCITPKIIDLHSPLHFDHPHSSCSSYATAYQAIYWGKKVNSQLTDLQKI